MHIVIMVNIRIRKLAHKEQEHHTTTACLPIPLQPVCKSDSTSIVTPTLFSRSIGGGSTNSLFKIYCEPGDGPDCQCHPKPSVWRFYGLIGWGWRPPHEASVADKVSSASQESNLDQPTPLPVAPQEHETVHECEALFYWPQCTLLLTKVTHT